MQGIDVWEQGHSIVPITDVIQCFISGEIVEQKQCSLGPQLTNHSHFRRRLSVQIKHFVVILVIPLIDD